jgi:hypothetical protein
MIFIEAQGRLGNQMFQYAFALAASRRLGTDFVMDDEELTRFFVLGGRSHAGPAPDYPCVVLNNEDYDEPEEVLAALADERHYKGFFQSQRFFAGAAAEVRAAFRFRPELVDAFRERYDGLLERPYVCCHVRRTDYETFAGGIVLPASYYRRSLGRLAPAAGTPVVFVGDNLDEVRAELGSLPGVRFEQNDAALDLQLVANAAAVVVSNSTFAWWGAWLNDRPGKRVLAPRYWAGFNHQTGWHRIGGAATAPRHRRDWEYPRGIVPDDWVSVPVRRPVRSALAPGAVKSSLALLANNARAFVAGG